MIDSADLKTYFDNARSFERDRLSEALKQRNLAFVVAVIALLLCVGLVVALIALTPLKTVEPFVIRVDNATGSADVIAGLNSAGPVSYDEAVTKYFAARYVASRENYSALEAASNFRVAALMSSPDEQGRVSAATKASNPDSYQAQLGKSGVVVATVKSISLLDKNVVQVRFDREIRQNDQRKISHWIATLTFTYTTATISSNDRLINPLGFVVSNYRLDAEAVQ